MNRLSIALSVVGISLSGIAMGQSDSPTPSSSEAEVLCSDIVASEIASAAEIAALNDTSIVTVLRCQAVDTAPVPANLDIDELRAAAAGNPVLASRFAVEGLEPSQVIAVRRTESGDFAIYVIGGFR